MEKVIDEYKDSRCIIKLGNGEIILNEDFKKVYVVECDKKGVIAFFDFEIFKYSINSFKETVLYKLLKEIDKKL